MYRTLVEAVLNHAEESGGKSALIVKNDVVSYRDLAKRVKNMASILKYQYRIPAGGRVMITGLSRPEYIVAFLAVQYLQAITIPLDKVWMEDTVLKLYDFARPDLILTDMPFHREGVRAASLEKLYEESMALRAEEGISESIQEGISDDIPGSIPDDTSDGIPDDTPEGISYLTPDRSHIAEMIFTTGTTGTPKGAMLTYGNILAITRNNVEGTGFRGTDVLLDPLPLCHSLGLRQVRMALYLGATVVLQSGFSLLDDLRENMEKYQCSACVCVPAMIEHLTRKMNDFPEVFGRLRLLEIGAGSLSSDMKRRLPQMLPDTQIYNTWGSSETGGVIFLDVSHRMDKIKAIGKPVSTARVKIVDMPSGKEIAARDAEHAGRLAIQGDMTMAGYYKMPDASSAALVDGWLYTNDLAFTDEEGFVYMLGRADDIINVGGEKVSPLEIENAATEHPKVFDAACIGVEDPVMGQVPALFVAMEDVRGKDNTGNMCGADQMGDMCGKDNVGNMCGADQASDMCRIEEVREFLASRLERYKRPSYIIRVNEIPRNRMQKLDRKAVRKLWEERQLQGDS